METRTTDRGCHLKASELALSDTRVLLWGPPGSGKTCFAGTLGEKLELIDLDGNAASLKTFQDQFRNDRLKVEVKQGLHADDPPGGQFALMKIKAYILDVAKRCREGKYEYKALCLDSMTTLFEVAKRQVLRTHTSKNQYHDLTLDQGQYQIVFNELLSIFEIMKALPIISILIAHEMTNEIDMVSSREIAIYGKQFPSQVRAMFPEILYCKNVTTVTSAGTVNNFQLQTVKSAGATARSCLNIKDGTPMSLGLPKILADAGVKL